MPFSRKLTPAAFPAFTTISRLARTEVCAGAISVSLATTGLPSAVRETQVVSSARISRVKVRGGFGAVLWVVGGFASGWLADVVEDAAGPAVGELAEPEGWVAVDAGVESGADD